MRATRALVIASAIVGLAACSKPAPEDTQIAAKVDKTEISVHQVEEALRRQPALVADQPATAAKVVLDSLIEQEIAAQAARSSGLDHEPAVVQALELARREVLAKALQERVAANVALPSAAEIDQFYAAKPALFAQRRVYVLRELAVESAPSALPALQQMAKLAQSPDELADALRKAGLSFRSRVFPKAPEDMDLALIDAFAALGEGQSIVVSQSGGALLYTVLRAQSAPVDRAAATQTISAYLLGAGRRETLLNHMKTLRGAAKVEYLGLFAAAAASQPVAASAPAAQ